jgi:hypothetical protein
MFGNITARLEDGKGFMAFDEEREIEIQRETN